MINYRYLQRFLKHILYLNYNDWINKSTQYYKNKQCVINHRKLVQSQGIPLHATHPNPGSTCGLAHLYLWYVFTPGYDQLFPLVCYQLYQLIFHSKYHLLNYPIWFFLFMTLFCYSGSKYLVNLCDRKRTERSRTEKRAFRQSEATL